jgi:hypothetical protein
MFLTEIPIVLIDCQLFLLESHNDNYLFSSPILYIFFKSYYIA